MSIIRNVPDVTPLVEFFETEVKPEEFIKSIDAVEHELCMFLIKTAQVTDAEVINGVYHIHALRMVLQQCMVQQPVIALPPEPTE